MSVANVQAFLDRTASDLDLLAKVRAARGADVNATAANVVSIAAAAGFSFTASEYQTEVQGEVATVYQMLRAVPHLILLLQQ
jgi:predicted ribosomally synthesized peptide with nif11-like leader